MTVFLIASAAGLLIGIGGACVLVTLRDALNRPKQTEPNPILLHELRPDGDEGRQTRSSRP